MYAFDLRTLYTSFVVMLVVCLAVVALLWWQNRKRFRGLELLVLYIVLQFFGLVLVKWQEFFLYKSHRFEYSTCLRIDIL